MPNRIAPFVQIGFAMDIIRRADGSLDENLNRFIRLIARDVNIDETAERIRRVGCFRSDRVGGRNLRRAPPFRLVPQLVGMRADADIQPDVDRLLRRFNFDERARRRIKTCTAPAMPVQADGNRRRGSCRRVVWDGAGEKIRRQGAA